MRWDMAVLRESPWYQEIQKEGQLEATLSSIEMSLEVKFNADGLQFMTEIVKIPDLEKLRIIQRGIMTLDSLDEVSEVIESVKSA